MRGDTRATNATSPPREPAIGELWTGKCLPKLAVGQIQVSQI
jgi:hypothetical protein